MLERFGFQGLRFGGEQVAILVGPNGAGKSNLLKKIAISIRDEYSVSVVCNTAYDRFSGMRGIRRISASRSSRSPKGIIKQAVAHTLDEPDSRFYQIGKILDYCGYRPRFGFKIEGINKRNIEAFYDELSLDPRDKEASFNFLNHHDPRQILWVDPGDSALGFSLAREFATVLRNEEKLRKARVFRDLQVYLQRHDGQEIELLAASSGELALISSLIFLITTIESNSVVLIDEPENSLHPSWQREYVDKVLNAIEYRNITVVVATHAPLVVTGAIAGFPELVSVFQVRNSEPNFLDLSKSSGSASCIEEILWRAFEVITPASHYVSERLVDIVTQLEQGKILRGTALAAVDELSDHSFESKQRNFFGAVRKLIDEVDSERRKETRTDD